MGTFTRAASVAVVGLGLIATQAFAAVTFDPATGEGFVGKGDIQTAFGWSNKQVQSKIDDVVFRASSETVTEVTWTCTKDNGNTNERELTTTTTTQGVVADADRVKKQITGYYLTGYSGTPETTTSTEGPAVGSCPTNWTASDVSDPQEVSSTTTLEASIGGAWVTLQ